jgi:hypothetical protein
MICSIGTRAAAFAKVTEKRRHQRGSSRGAAWADYDNDGFLDLFVANERGQNSFLFHNNGDGSFSKITSGNIVSDRGASTGCAWGDYDNDGFVDLFVNNTGKNFLYHNNRNSTFPRLHPARLERMGATRSARQGVDNDGFLDLFVANASQKVSLPQQIPALSGASLVVTGVGYSWCCLGGLRQ